MEDSEEYQRKKPSNLVLKKKASSINSKDFAKIQYNYKDFLSQFENLSEQCVTLVEQLSMGTYDCVICQNPIGQLAKIWNC